MITRFQYAGSKSTKKASTTIEKKKKKSECIRYLMPEMEGVSRLIPGPEHTDEWEPRSGGARVVAARLQAAE
jgi:hypothetical protein